MAKTVTVEDIPDVETLPGYKALTPVHKLRPSKATRIMAAVREDDPAAEQAAAVVEAVEEYAVEDEARWAKVFADEGVQGVITLAMAYLVKLVGGND